MRVALFVTCLVDGLFPDVGKATVRLLRRLGQDVEVPMSQTCCGQLLVNTGYPREALPLIRNHVQTFLDYDAVVVPERLLHGGHPPPARDDRAGLRRAAPRSGGRIGRATHLRAVGVSRRRAEGHRRRWHPHRVTYHPACHSLRALEIGERPMQLLRAVRGIDLVPLPDAQSCCGFGGTFAVKDPMSRLRCWPTR